MVRDATLGSDTAGSKRARILALVVLAVLIHGAVAVGAATHRTGTAVTDVTLWALRVGSAFRTTAVLDAGLAAATASVAAARRCAEAVVAAGPRRTVGLGSASNRGLRTACLRVSDRSSRTGALHGVVDHLALGAGTAGVSVFTRICYEKIIK